MKNFVYTLMCHDPIENEELLLLETDDRSLALRIMQHRRNIDGDLYTYYIAVRSEVNASEELRRTDKAVAAFVALRPCFDEDGSFYYDEVPCSIADIGRYTDHGCEIILKDTFDGMYIPVEGVPVAEYDSSDDLPF